MEHSTVSVRLQRLDLLEARLKSGEAMTAGGLAKELGVSLRTINRDIALLRDRGLPVESDIGRGGGIRLHRHWAIGRINLSYSEAVDLMVSLAIAEQMDSPIFLAHLKSVRSKLRASFSPAMSHKIDSLKSRIQIGKSVSAAVLSGFSKPDPAVTERLNQAFLMMNPVRITYRDMKESVTEREIEPHYLLLNYPVWYVLAWDRLREDVRTFRCDRILQLESIDESFQLIPIRQFKKALEGVQTI
ncbi:putative DNA-binding transcriptional regulator YafY, contains an HTH and WYL domains [Mariprofundus aestuarium]|uniref:Putative DNA-binding transcriptional regulator YafY, contains an HTH and WYL domains n=1 Tax=Mariprofundus aestuarium TaxID=1921086 RepID=A0A2K8L6X0_MARES|nr:WYL domain-containing protein [Mariprofundus aestuarium]ATX80714.1 putative DNA-binding transcriptional regulator YafY, contains an HTH and WYL domains [Mariprofundus aestuarium]